MVVTAYRKRELSMGHPGNDNAVWAYLDATNTVILCTRKEANAWWYSEEGKRAQIKYDEIDGWDVDTRFWRFSLFPDGPPLFWRVSWFTGNIVTGYWSGGRHFGTMEAGLEFHAGVMATIRNGGVPEATIHEDGLEEYESGWSNDPEESDSAYWWKE
jgi:hypothetical protein